MSDRYVLALPPIAGLISGYDGVALDFARLPADSRIEQVDLRLDVVHAQNVTVTLTGGATGTILAGEKFGTSANLVDVSAGTQLQATYTTGAGTGMGLSGTVWLTTAAAAGVLPEGLVSLAEVKAALSLTSTTPEEDAFLQRQINVVSERIRGHCDRHFNLRMYRDTWRWPNIVHTTEWPITQINNASRDGTTIDPAELRVNLRTGRIYQRALDAPDDWARSVRDLVVEYTAGFNPIPPTVQEVCFQGIERKWESYQATRSNLPTQTVRRVAWVDVGAVDYQTESQLGRYSIVDPLAGIPLDSLNQFMAPGEVLGGPSESQFWEVL